MSRSLQFPGVLFFSPEFAGKRVFNEEEINKVETINLHIENAMSRIERAEQLYKQSRCARKKAAWDEGYQFGLKQASEKMLEVMAACQSTENIMTQITLSAISKVLEDLPKDILVPSLACTAVRKLSRDYSQMTVCVHPKFVELVKERLHLVLKDFPVLKQVDVIEDATMAETDCQIRTNLGMVNANLTTQLAAIEKVFTEKHVDAES